MEGYKCYIAVVVLGVLGVLGVFSNDANPKADDIIRVVSLFFIVLFF